MHMHVHKIQHSPQTEAFRSMRFLILQIEFIKIEKMHCLARGIFIYQKKILLAWRNYILKKQEKHYCKYFLQCSKSNGLRDGWKGSPSQDMFFFAASWQFFSPRQKIWNIKQPQNTLFLILKNREIKVKEIQD